MAHNIKAQQLLLLLLCGKTLLLWQAGFSAGFESKGQNQEIIRRRKLSSATGDSSLPSLSCQWQASSKWKRETVENMPLFFLLIFNAWTRNVPHDGSTGCKMQRSCYTQQRGQRRLDIEAPVLQKLPRGRISLNITGCNVRFSCAQVVSIEFIF